MKNLWLAFVAVLAMGMSAYGAYKVTCSGGCGMGGGCCAHATK